MNFEVRGKIFGMEMPSTWKYYPEGLLVLPENAVVSFSGEVYDENHNPIDVVVQKHELWGGYVVLFKDYTSNMTKIYRSFGVFTTEETAIYVARMVLLCNRACQYNWKGLNQIILYGEKFDLDTVMAIAFLHLLFSKTAANEILLNPKPNDCEFIVNPIVLVERPVIDSSSEDDKATKGIRRKTRSYTRLLMKHFHHHISGISFYNEDAFMREVMEIIEGDDGGEHSKRWSWQEIEISGMLSAIEEKLKLIYEHYSSGIIPTEYLETIVKRDTIIAPGYLSSIKREKESDDERDEEDED